MPRLRDPLSSIPMDRLDRAKLRRAIDKVREFMPPGLGVCVDSEGHTWLESGERRGSREQIEAALRLISISSEMGVEG